METKLVIENLFDLFNSEYNKKVTHTHLHIDLPLLNLNDFAVEKIVDFISHTNYTHIYINLEHNTSLHEDATQHLLEVINKTNSIVSLELYLTEFTNKNTYEQ